MCEMSEVLDICAFISMGLHLDIRIYYRDVIVVYFVWLVG